MIYLFIIIIALSLNANSQNIIDSTTMNLPSFVVIPKYKKTKSKLENLGCNPYFIKLDFQTDYDANFEYDKFTLLADKSLVMKILDKYYYFIDPNEMFDRSGIEGLGDGDLYTLINPDSVKRFKIMYETYECLKGKENVQVKELIEIKNKNEKFSKLKDVKVTESEYIFPAPFIGVNDRLEIDLDSIKKLILNTTGIYYPFSHDSSYVLGMGKLIKDVPDFIYYKNHGMVQNYGDEIFSYFVTKYNQEIDREGKTINKKILNYKLSTGNELYEDGTFDVVNKLGVDRTLKFISCSNYNDVNTCQISTVVAAYKPIGDSSVFVKNKITGFQELDINYNFLGRKLSSIIIDFPIWENLKEGVFPSNITKNGNDKLFDSFVNYLNNKLGKSVLYKSSRDKWDVLRVWKKGNCTLTIRYKDFKGYKTINKVIYIDESYTKKYIEEYLKNNPDKNGVYYYNSFYPSPIDLLKSGIFR